MRSVSHRHLLALGLVVMLVATLPVNAEAQRGRGGGSGSRGSGASAGSGSGVRRGPGPQSGPTRVVYGGGYYGQRYYRPYYYRPYYYPYYYRPFYSPYYYGFYGYPFYAGFGFGWSSYPYYYPPYGYGYYDSSSAVRIEVKPERAEVYVDGYLAGTVDDFDGWLQRLHLPPGGHEIVIRLEGYRVIRHRVMLRPGVTHTIKEPLQPLGSGETTEPVPVPTEPPDPPQGGDPRRPYPERSPVEERERVRVESNFGAVAIRVQPKEAQILIDGEPWRGAEGVDRLVVQLSEGTHRVEVRMEGRQPFSTEVRIRRDETTTLNVSLPPQN